ncbi:DEGP9, partial [Symbiodinium microadriaticum]
ESDQEPVVLTQVLASEVTVGYSDLENEVLETFNGEKVGELFQMSQEVWY